GTVKIYFDTCCLHRPLDDKTQPRVAREAEAVLSVLTICEAGMATLVSSEALFLENGRDPDSKGRAFVESILEQSPAFVTLDDDITQRAKILETRGFKALDALHVASAESAKVDYLCSCDDQLLKKSRTQTDLAIKVVSPLELAKELSA